MENQGCENASYNIMHDAIQLSELLGPVHFRISEFWPSEVQLQ